jgi:hypothetical protein
MRVKFRQIISKYFRSRQIEAIDLSLVTSDLFGFVRLDSSIRF